MITRIAVIALVLMAQTTLSALAFASPPDPTWIAGIYDDADYDDVVALVTAEMGSVAPLVPAVSPLDPALSAGRLDDGETAALRWTSALRPRSPPAA